MITVTDSQSLTNQLLIDELELWELFDSKSISDDKTKRYYQLIDDIIDTQIGESIAWLKSDAAKEYFFQQVELEKEIFDALEDSWDDIFDNSYEKVDDLLDAIYDEGKKQGYSQMKETVRYTDADIQAIRLAKDYNFDLIRNLTGDLQTTVKNKILQGIITGENPYNLSRTLSKAGVTKLDGSPFTARQRATMIAKTETSRMQNTGMVQSYLNEGFTQVKILTAEDNHVCTTCLNYAYHYNKETPLTFENRGKEKVHNIVDLIKGGRFPPFHPNCRCTYLIVWESKTDAPDNPPVINLTPVGANIRRQEKELPEPTKEQLKKNLRPTEREKYESYKRNIPRQRQWLKDHPDAPAEEIAKHQKRLAFLEKKFLELKKKALGGETKPVKPKKEKPKTPKPKKEEPTPKPEPKKEKPKEPQSVNPRIAELEKEISEQQKIVDKWRKRGNAEVAESFESTVKQLTEELNKLKNTNNNNQSIKEIPNKDLIDDVLTDVLNDIGLGDKAPKTKSEAISKDIKTTHESNLWENLAKKHDLELIEASNSFVKYYDKKFDTRIEFNINSNKDWIDYTNSNKKDRNMEDFLKYYKESPSNYKKASPPIKIIGSAYYDGVCELNTSDTHHIKIGRSGYCTLKMQPGSGNLQQTMYHEMSHAFDQRHAPDRVMAVMSKGYWWSSQKGGIYKKSTTKDRRNREKTGGKQFVSDYAKTGSSGGNLTEDMAELGSIVAMRDLKDKSNAYLYEYNEQGEYVKVHYDELKKRYPNKWKALEKEIFEGDIVW